MNSIRNWASRWIKAKDRGVRHLLGALVWVTFCWCFTGLLYFGIKLLEGGCG